jgi:alpha-1,3-mannosyltransferase
MKIASLLWIVLMCDVDHGTMAYFCDAHHILTMRPGATVRLLLLAELAAGLLILRVARYTEIDWKAYMQEVQAVADGQRNYTAIRANTGPLVYPAGFVWLFLGLHRLTGADPDCCRLPPTPISESTRCVSGGGDVALAQHIYLGLYLATLAVVLKTYRRCGVPRWAWPLACLSYRVHSLYLLRLFNDAPAMLLLHGFVLAYASRRFLLGALLFSAALSLKMNALLFAPALAILTLRECGWVGAIARAIPPLALQALLAAPFLRSNAHGYVSRAFELSRAFEHRWSVNWAMVSPSTFRAPRFAAALLAAHAALLLAFAHRRWCLECGGLPRLLRTAVRGPPSQRQDGRSASARETVVTAFTCNFIGVATARSLHYQFYLFYFFSLPVLLWATPLPTPVRLLLWAGIEWAYNVYPPSPASSAVLQACHAVILLGLWLGSGVAQPGGGDESCGAAKRR